MGGQWAVGHGPFLRDDNLKTKCGRRQSLDNVRIYKSRICPKFVHATNTRIYVHFRRRAAIGQNVAKLRISTSPKIVHLLSANSVTRC